MAVILDLFCGAGGAAVGYHRAGFTVVGVDHGDQPDYPYTFHCGDALEALAELGDDIDAVHASPPCQDYSTMSNRHGSKQPRLIDELRDLLPDDRPWVIENVDGAHLDGIRLTGPMFDLPIWRPRRFESNMLLMSPPRERRPAESVAVYGPPDGRRLWERLDGSTLHAWRSIEEGQQALGIDWTTDWHQLREAIPPAYTEWIGRQLIDSLT